MKCGMMREFAVWTRLAILALFVAVTVRSCWQMN